MKAEEIIERATQDIAYKYLDEKGKIDFESGVLAGYKMARENQKEMSEKSDISIEIHGKKPIFHVVMNHEDFGLSLEDAKDQCMHEEYAVIKREKADAGLIVYGKNNGVWFSNPFSNRFLIRVLLEKIGIKL